MLSLPSPLIHMHTYKWRILCSTWQFPYMMLNPELVWSDNHKGHMIPWYSWLHIEGILPKGPYLPCPFSRIPSIYGFWNRWDVHANDAKCKTSILTYIWIYVCTWISLIKNWSIVLVWKLSLTILSGIPLSWHCLALCVTGDCNHFTQVTTTVSHINYAHSFVMFCFVVIIQILVVLDDWAVSFFCLCHLVCGT